MELIAMRHKRCKNVIYSKKQSGQADGRELQCNLGDIDIPVPGSP